MFFYIYHVAVFATLYVTNTDIISNKWKTPLGNL